MDMNQDEIVKLATQVVESFINDKVPLTEGIAKCASETGLNPDQLKRLIETSNSTAYLELLKTAEDRTFEFPVANYEQVMTKVAFPEDLILDVEAKKGIETNSTGDGESINKKDLGTEQRTIEDERPGMKAAGMLKAAEYDADTHYSNAEIQAVLQEDPVDLIDAQKTPEEKRAMLMKYSMANKRQLEKVAVDKQIIGLEIDEAVKVLRGDPFCLEKLAEVSEETEFNTLKPFFHEKQALETKVFRDSELKVARSLVGLLKAAKEIVAEEQKLATIEKRSKKLLSKNAGVGLTGLKTADKIATGVGLGSKGNLLGAVANTVPEKQDAWKVLHGN